MTIWLKQSTAVELKLGPFVDSVDGVTPETGLTITQSEVLLAKNAGDWAQKNEATSMVHESNGWYRCLLDTTDTNTLGVLRLQIAEAGALPVWAEFMVVPAGIYAGLIEGTKLIFTAGVEITQSTSNGAGLYISGNGTGHGIAAYSGSGATGNGINAQSLATNGSGIFAYGTGTQAGLYASGGSGAATGPGIYATSGLGATGDGIKAEAISTNGHGFNFIGRGTGSGLLATGGATGNAFRLAGGGTSGAGVLITTTSGDGITVTPTAGHGLNLAANGTSKHGLFATGGTAGTSHGIAAVAGSGGQPISGGVDVTRINAVELAATRLAQMFGAAQLITVDDATFTPTTTAFETDQTADEEGEYRSQVLYCATGANAGMVVRVSDYDFTNSKVKLTTDALRVAPADGDTFIKMGRSTLT